MEIINFKFFLTLFAVVILGISSNGSYTRGLIKYLRQDSRLHQVMFIIHDQLLLNSSSSANLLITDVSEHFPSFSTSLSKLRISLKKHFPPASKRPRRTTLFIMILNGTRNEAWSHVYFILMQLKELSEGHSYPKCLINLVSQNESHPVRKILEYFWSQDFLEISVLKHLQENQNPLTRGVGKQPILYEFNLFAKTYSARKVTATTKWFSNKLLNLHRYQMNFIIADVGDILKKVYRFATIFSETMHCSVSVLYINKSIISRTHNFLYSKKAEMILNPVIQRILNDIPGSPKIRIVDFSSVKAVLPVTSSSTKEIVISEEFTFMLLVTTIAIFTIRITAWILKFNRNTWEVFNLSRIIMGMSIGSEPRKTAERIVFGILMLSCIVYSGYLYSVILDISFRAESQISNIEELVNSTLTPSMHEFERNSLMKSPISYIRKLATKATEVSSIQTAYDCLAYLTKYANVTCITHDSENLVNAFKTGHQEFNGRILQEPLDIYHRTWRARSGSPYLDRLNEVILRASEVGLLLQAWRKPEIQPSKPPPPEVVSKEKLLLILFYVLVIGYSLAILAFIVEKLSVINWRKVNFFASNASDAQETEIV